MCQKCHRHCTGTLQLVRIIMEKSERRDMFWEETSFENVNWQRIFYVRHLYTRTANL